METKQCEICGRTLPASDFSKSYRNRGKECVAKLTREKRAAKQEINNLNGVIVNGKVYEATFDNHFDDCDDCALDLDDCKGVCSGFGAFCIFKYSKTLTDKLIKQ